MIVYTEAEGRKEMDETPYVMTVNSQKYGNAVMADAQIKKMLRAAVLKIS